MPAEISAPPVQESLPPATNAWNIDRFSGLREVTENREMIYAAGQEISETFDIQPEFFEDHGRSLVFTAIADRWSRAGDNEAEKAFLADSLTLLARDYSPLLADAKKQIEQEKAPLSDEAQLAVYDKYTNRELSDRLKGAIDAGLLDGVKERLGVTTENEEPYEVRVLSLGTEYDASGLMQEVPDWENFAGNYEELMQIQAEYDETRSAITLWKDGLQARRSNFNQALGNHKEFSAPAWVTRIGDKTLLNIPMALAEKILYPELTHNASYYNDDDRERDLALLEHEYVHTQGFLAIDHNLEFGIAIEEIRAEHFSGNKHGYLDIKNFWSDVHTISGLELSGLIDGKEKGGTPEKIYSELADEVGLSRMLELVMTQPLVYGKEQSNVFIRHAHEYLGGFDGVLGRLLEDARAAGKGDEIDERVREMAKKVGENSWLIDYRRDNFGLSVVSNMIEEELKSATTPNNT